MGAEHEVPKEFTIKITFNPHTNDCRVEGPLKNKELTLLGMALGREVMDQQWRRMSKTTIVMPQIKLPNFRKLLENGG